MTRQGRRHDDRFLYRVTTGTVDQPAIVLVHGTLDRSAGLSKLARRLDERFRVERYDRRGYGRSRSVPGPRTVQANVDDLTSIIESEPQPVVLFGHSFGGDIVLAAAQRLPELIAYVAVYEAPLSWRPDWPGSTGANDPNRWLSDPESAAEGFMRRLVGDRVWDRLPASTRDDRRAEGSTMVAELIDLKRSAPWDPARIRVPVLAMCGERSSDYHRAAMGTIAETVSGARLVEIAGAGHFGPNTHPAVVGHELLAVLDE